MGMYICTLCDRMFDHHEVVCYEYGHNQLICEDCYDKYEELIREQQRERGQ